MVVSLVSIINGMRGYGHRDDATRLLCTGSVTCACISVIRQCRMSLAVARAHCAAGSEISIATCRRRRCGVRCMLYVSRDLSMSRLSVTISDVGSVSPIFSTRPYLLSLEATVHASAAKQHL